MPILCCRIGPSVAFRICAVQSAMMKTDAGTCASLSVSLLTTSRLSNHCLLYTPIDLRFRLYQQSNQTSMSLLILILKRVNAKFEFMATNII